jgi:hypothetical protein
LTRHQAEIVLSGHENGVFLIRDSCYFPGKLTLSFVFNNSYEHFVIEKYKNFVSIDKQTWFISISELVKFYQLNKNNLCTNLTIGLSSHNLISGSQVANQMTIVPLNELKFEDIIGSGEFANVRKGWWRNHQVAIKQFKDTSTSVSNLLQEANIMM